MSEFGARKDVYGEPDQWWFDYDWPLVRTGFYLWAMSDFQRLPTQDEVLAYDPRWIGDMQLTYQIYAHQHNDSDMMKILEASKNKEGALRFGMQNGELPET